MNSCQPARTPGGGRWCYLLAVTLAAVGACDVDRERPRFESTEPLVVPDVTGSYEATQLIVQRPSGANDLVGEPDTRLSLHLNAGGTAQGQLKIGADPELRTKQVLAGRWRLALPSRVVFDFDQPTFLEDIGFQIFPAGLSGEWLGQDIRIKVVLEKVG